MFVPLGWIGCAIKIYFFDNSIIIMKKGDFNLKRLVKKIKKCSMKYKTLNF